MNKGNNMTLNLNICGEQVNLAQDSAILNTTQYNGKIREESKAINVITYSQKIIYTNNFVGRNAEIHTILKKIEAHKRILISGIGGIGKTTVLQKIYNIYCDKYRFEDNLALGYFDYQLSIEDTICNAMEFEKTGEKAVDTKKAIRILENYANSKKLFVFINNFPTGKYEEIQKLDSVNGTIIITSRQRKYENYETIFIDKLDIDDCKRLFEKERGIRHDLDKLDYIIDTLIGRHTLTIKLLANIARKKQWSVTELADQLDKVRFKLHYNDNGNDTDLLTQYKKLYSISDLNHSQKNILEGFSILRDVSLDRNKYIKYLAADAKDMECDELSELIEKGWIEINGTIFSIHPVFAEFISESKEIDMGEHQQLSKAMKSSCCYLDDLNVLRNQEYLPELMSFVKYAFLDDKEVIYNVAYLAKACAEYENAIAVINKIEEIDGSIFFKAQLLLSEIYLYKSQFEKSKTCLENVSKHIKENDDIYVDFTITYAIYLEKSSTCNLDRQKAIEKLEEIQEHVRDDITKSRVYNCLGAFLLSNK